MTFCMTVLNFKCNLFQNKKYTISSFSICQNMDINYLEKRKSKKLIEEIFKKLILKIAHFYGIEKCIILYKILCQNLLPWKRISNKTCIMGQYLTKPIIILHNHKHF